MAMLECNIFKAFLGGTFIIFGWMGTGGDGWGSGQGECGKVCGDGGVDCGGHLEIRDDIRNTEFCSGVVFLMFGSLAECRC